MASDDNKCPSVWTGAPCDCNECIAERLAKVEAHTLNLRAAAWGFAVAVAVGVIIGLVAL